MAKKIESINISRFNAEDLCGLLLAIKNCFLQRLEAVPPFAENFSQTTDALHQVLTPQEKVNYTKQLEETDSRLELRWRNLRDVLSVMMYHPDEAVRTAAEQVKNVFSLTPNPNKLPYTTQIANISRLMTQLEGIPLEVREASFAQPFIVELEKAMRAFDEVYNAREQNMIAQHKISVSDVKATAIAAYHEMIEDMNATLRLHPDEDLEVVADFINNQIAKKKILLKSVKSRSTDSDHDDAPAVEAAALPPDTENP